MSENAYNQLPYETRVRIEMHPDRLAAVGRLYGMNPAPVDQCRYLEIGCGSGDHVICLAYYLPRSHFVGIDLADHPISLGEQTRTALALDNLTLLALDLRDLPAHLGPFDYIAVHGLYSWVPPDVRDALLRLTAERLAPQGIAFVSYNTLPGRHARQYLRDFMRFHARAAASPADQLKQARRALRLLKSSPEFPDFWRPLIDQETSLLLALPDHALYHDDLADTSDPIYFRDFAAHAERHGLQYLGDADPPVMFDPHGFHDELTATPVEQAQYLDFLRARMFRQTLLCRRDVPLTRRSIESCAAEFLYSSLTRTVDNSQIEGLRKVRITPLQEAARNVASALGEVFPLPLTFEELIPYAGDSTSLSEILAGMAISGFADFHVYRFPCQETVTERPVASRLARYQARTRTMLTSACCRLVELDDIGRRLIQLLDGTRDAARLAADLSLTPGAPPLADIERHLPTSLEWMAHATLFEA